MRCVSGDGAEVPGVKGCAALGFLRYRAGVGPFVGRGAVQPFDLPLVWSLARPLFLAFVAAQQHVKQWFSGRKGMIAARLRDCVSSGYSIRGIFSRSAMV